MNHFYVTLCQNMIFGPNNEVCEKLFKIVNLIFLRISRPKFLNFSGKKVQNILIFASKLIKIQLFCTIVGQNLDF